MLLFNNEDFTIFYFFFFFFFFFAALINNVNAEDNNIDSHWMEIYKYIDETLYTQ